MEEVTRNKHAEDDASDLEKIVNAMKSKLRATSASAGREAASCTIYRAPNAIRQGNEKSFEPQLVSIGPYHINNEELKAMEGRKLEHLQSILFRNSRMELKDYVKKMKQLEDSAKKCYSDIDQSMSGSCLGGIEFVEMLLLDGCFLVEMFLRIRSSSSEAGQEQAKKLQGSDLCWLRHFVSFDMLLLENQLPFFVLEAILGLVQGEPSGGSPSLKDLALGCFKLVRGMPLNKDAKAKESYNHLLDLFHHHCLPQSPNKSEAATATASRPKSRLMQERLDPGIEEQIIFDCGHFEQATAQPREKPLLADSEVVRRGMGNSRPKKKSADGSDDKRSSKRKSKLFAIPSAEQLQDSGIQFKKKEDGGSFLDIRYEKKGVIEIPYLYFSDKLKSIFQNLIAYEQCCPDAGTFFTGYAFFMDDVINTGKDVRILRHSEILEHGLGSDEGLAHHFNQLSKGVFGDDRSSIHLYNKRIEINEYSRRRNHIATLKREYFHSPWAALSLAGAILGLSLSILMT